MNNGSLMRPLVRELLRPSCSAAVTGAAIAGMAAFALAGPSNAIGASSRHVLPPGIPLNVQVSHDGYQTYGEPYLAVNPRNPRNLVGTSQCINSLPVPCTFVSFDGGISWHDNGALPLPPGDKGGGDVSVLFDARGIGFVASSAGPDTGVNSVLVWRTQDGGHAFERPVVVFHSAKQKVDHPWLAVDTTRGPRAGSVYVVWTSNEGRGFSSGTRLLFSRSLDRGRTFTQARTIVRVTDGFPGVPLITVGVAGAIDVFYAIGHRNPYTPPFHPLLRYVMTSSDGGMTFGRSHAIAAEPVFFALSHLVTANIQAPATSDGQLLCMVMAAYRPGTHRTDILLWRSRNGGRAWTAPVRVNSDPTSDLADHFQPQVIVTSHGTVYVSYFRSIHRRITVFLARSDNQGASFRASQRISGVPFDPVLSAEHRQGSSWIGDYQGLAAAPNIIHVFWNDTRTGHMEIFTAEVPNT